eukprot:143894-Pyramimonas_sp.AAC.1
MSKLKRQKPTLEVMQPKRKQFAAPIRSAGAEQLLRIVALLSGPVAAFAWHKKHLPKHAIKRMAPLKKTESSDLREPGRHIYI